MDVHLPDGRSERLRLIGTHPRKTVQYFGVETSNRAKERLPPGLAVRLELDPTQGERDWYGYLLS